jgi:hypothetical protein
MGDAARSVQAAFRMCLLAMRARKRGLFCTNQVMGEMPLSPDRLGQPRLPGMLISYRGEDGVDDPDPVHYLARISHGISDMRGFPGADKVVLLSHSGCTYIASLYQTVAEDGPSPDAHFTSRPALRRPGEVGAQAVSRTAPGARPGEPGQSPASPGRGSCQGRGRRQREARR